MTKKDYIKIAEILVRSKKESIEKYNKIIDWDILIGNFIEILKEDNPMFNKEKFIKAIRA